jgi:CYTH domain-containing protein
LASGREIERKFLVSAMPEHRGPGTAIAQGYLPLAGDDTKLRVRREGDATVVTVKRGSGLDAARKRPRSAPRRSMRSGR